MATDFESYDGRRPAFGIGGHQRGFRSKPGAPMAQPWLNKGAVGSSSSLTPQSNWDSVFRNTTSNQFGAGGAVNPRYQSSFGMSETPGAPRAGISSTNFTEGEDQIAQLGSSPGGSSLLNNDTHAQAWSKPMPRTTNPLAGGYEAGNPLDILSKYQTPNTTASMFQAPNKKNPFGWFKSFDQNG